MKTLIMKFGGSALANPPRMKRAVSISLRESTRWDRLLIVVAALEGVTDQLLNVARLAAERDARGYRRIIHDIRERHIQGIEEMFVDASVRESITAQMDRLLFNLLTDCQSSEQRPSALPRWSDRIVAVGEKMVTMLFAALLRQEELAAVALDATRFLITDATFGNAQPNWQESAASIEAQVLPLFTDGYIPVVTGYIGCTREGEITTLGRGGSDFTASILGVCLQADEVWLWSSVAGLMSADPEWVSTARVIDELDYGDAAELAYYGARVLHLKMIAPLQSAGIPLRVKSIHQPAAAGTYIHHVSEAGNSVLGVTALPGIAIRPIKALQRLQVRQERDDSQMETLLLLNELDRLSAISAGNLELMSVSQSSSGSLWCVCATARATAEDMNRLGEALCQPKEGGRDARWEWQAITLVTVVGNTALQDAPGDAWQRQLADLQVLGHTRGAHPTAMSFILAASDGAAAVHRLHESLIQQT
ncbi:MAG: aspartate kinase [Anaerolineaceae bacterium]|nr:aspartate kinase [Anaerolineaceae bacterium]